MATTLLLFLLIIFAAGVAGGALGGVKLAGADLGKELAALMGALYGGSLALPAAVVSAAILYLVRFA